MTAASPKCYGGHVTVTLQLWWVGGRREAKVKKQCQRKRTEEGLPLTGPMKIISEARMKRKRMKEEAKQL